MGNITPVPLTELPRERFIENLLGYVSMYHNCLNLGCDHFDDILGQAQNLATKFYWRVPDPYVTVKEVRDVLWKYHFHLTEEEKTGLFHTFEYLFNPPNSDVSPRSLLHLSRCAIRQIFPDVDDNERSVQLHISDDLVSYLRLEW